MNRELRNRIATLLTGSALTIAAGSASAISVTDLGSLPHQPGSVYFEAEASFYSWDGYNNFTPDCGWAHNSNWYTVKVPYNNTVQITMTTDVAGLNPAFSVWKTNGKFVGDLHTSHKYNQVSLGGSSAFLKPVPGGGGATQFIGYANSGTSFTNCDGSLVKKGTSHISYVETGTAAFSKTLTPGLYLIAAGGSCNTESCGTPPIKGKFKIDIRKAPVVPLPTLDVCSAAAQC